MKPFSKEVSTEVQESIVDRTNLYTFQANAFMQCEALAIEIHIKNLITTYGPEMVKDIATKLLKVAA